MSGHLTATVIGKGQFHLLRWLSQFMSKGLGDMVGLLGFERYEDQGSGGTFYECTNG
jgi:hypothetical protein